MPDIYTHILNGRECLKRLGCTQKAAITRSLNLFYLGCMGPDIFLYHNFYPWMRDRSVNELGGKMHEQHCGELIVTALKHISDNVKDNILMDSRVIYFLGYICHYAADRLAHPYIISRSGFYDKTRPETHRYRNAHKIMELAIDYHMARKLDNQDVNKIRMNSFIDVGDEIPGNIEELYNYVFTVYFKGYVDKLSRDFINQSYLYIKKAWSIFYDPTCLKRYMLKLIKCDQYFYPLNPYKRDYMNEAETQWPYPWNCSMTSKKTFYQIFDESVDLSVYLTNAAIDYLSGKITYSKLNDNMGNYSFTTNMDASEGGHEFKCFSTIF